VSPWGRDRLRVRVDSAGISCQTRNRRFERFPLRDRTTSHASAFFLLPTRSSSRGFPRTRDVPSDTKRFCQMGVWKVLECACACAKRHGGRPGCAPPNPNRSNALATVSTPRTEIRTGMIVDRDSRHEAGLDEGRFLIRGRLCARSVEFVAVLGLRSACGTELVGASTPANLPCNFATRSKHRSGQAKRQLQRHGSSCAHVRRAPLTERTR